MLGGIRWRYIVGGFAFFMMSKPIELLGDSAPIGSGERLGLHILALVFVLLAVASFVRGVLLELRGSAERAPREPFGYAAILADTPDSETQIDPDAALARYMKTKSAEGQPSPLSAPPRPQGVGFGRKQV